MTQSQESATLYWFGEPWQASVCQNQGLRVPVPVGALCGDCQQPLDASSRGVIALCGDKDGFLFVAFQLEARLAAVVGTRPVGNRRPVPAASMAILSTPRAATSRLQF